MLFSCIYAKNVVLLHPISSRDGGIGRHEGLKILWPVMAVRVQVPLAVLKDNMGALSLLKSANRLAFASGAQGLT